MIGYMSYRTMSTPDPTIPPVVHQYLNKYTTVQLPPGFADFIKGTLYLYQTCRAHGRTLLVDFTHHPIGKFMRPSRPLTNPTPTPTTETVECFNQHAHKILPLIQSPPSPPHPQYMACNHAYPRFDQHDLDPPVLDPETQTFIHSILLFDPEIIEDTQYLRTQLGLGLDPHLSPYATLHIRMGDHNSIHAEIPLPPILHHYIQTVILPRWGNRVLILSDSVYTKTTLGNQYGLKYTEFTPVHLGSTERFLSPQDGTTSDTEIGQTLMEWYLMSQSSHIYVFSVYEWVSGFSKVCSHIYNIPLTVIH